MTLAPDSDPLLAWLGADRASAIVRLEELRQRLVYFFRRHQRPDAEDLAGEVVLTMVTKCAAGAHATYAAPEQLMIGIANKLLLRTITRRDPAVVDLDQVDHEPRRSRLPIRAQSDERRCLDQALPLLEKGDRALLKNYFGGDEWERAALARRLGMTSTALRVRVHRLTQRLAGLIDPCVAASRATRNA